MSYLLFSVIRRGFDLKLWRHRWQEVLLVLQQQKVDNNIGGLETFAVFYGSISRDLLFIIIIYYFFNRTSGFRLNRSVESKIKIFFKQQLVFVRNMNWLQLR